MLLGPEGSDVQPPGAGVRAWDGLGWDGSLQSSTGDALGAGSCPLLQDEHLGFAQGKQQAYMDMFNIYFYICTLEMHFIF